MEPLFSVPTRLLLTAHISRPFPLPIRTVSPAAHYLFISGCTARRLGFPAPVNTYSLFPYDSSTHEPQGYCWQLITIPSLWVIVVGVMDDAIIWFICLPADTVQSGLGRLCWASRELINLHMQVCLYSRVLVASQTRTQQNAANSSAPGQ
jgi:hypothetical protein